MAETVLTIEGLKTYFSRHDGLWIKAVDGVDLTVAKGETLCIVGESGCGKSMMALSIMGLVPRPRGQIVGGRILLGDADLTRLGDMQMCAVRGNQISMIFQEPMTSLNPVKTIGAQVAEAVLTHSDKSAGEAMRMTVEMLKMVGIPRAEKIVREYPHQLSGGMRQRVMIAMALICDPALLIADEPTTALDVTIQAQVLGLIRDMKRQLGTAVIFITHDLGVVAQMADHVAVMYAGQIVESSDVRTLFQDPRHPYTRALLASIPFMDQQKDVLYSIRGTVPDAAHYPVGCRFEARCDAPKCERCFSEEMPGLEDVAPGHAARCFLARQEVTA